MLISDVPSPDVDINEQKHCAKLRLQGLKPVLNPKVLNAVIKNTQAQIDISHVERLDSGNGRIGVAYV